jgi:hypothetical protein
MLMRLAFVFAKIFVKSMDYHIKTELSLASLTATRPRIKLNQVGRFDVKRTLRIALDGRRGSGTLSPFRALHVQRQSSALPKSFKKGNVKLGRLPPVSAKSAAFLGRSDDVR